MVEVDFLTLVLSLLHLGQATTCQGDDCPTGLIISGGFEAETNIETFPADDANCMNIPPFPAPGRWAHTLSVIENGRQLVVCGGRSTETSCISWISGQEEWTHYATLSQGRKRHAAVQINERIILLGGSGSVTNAQISGEIVKEGGSLLTLRNGARGTCALVWEDGFLTIGGHSGSGGLMGGVSAHGKVDRYDSEGKYLDSLPNLGTPRYNHACTSFLMNGEQALLVAGGRDGSAIFESTEIYSNGVWRPGGNLPRALSGVRAAHLNQQVVVTGGRDGSNERDEVLQYNIETGAWTQMDKKMRIPRTDHAIVEVNLANLCAASGATTTTGLDPLLALLICLILLCCRGCNNSCTRQGENKQSL